MTRIRLLPIVLALVLWAVAHARADNYDAGLGAYASGDYAGALAEWRPLAEQGHAEAQFGVAEMYDQGRGVPADAETAAAWYQKAAEQGNARAQAMLGTMFATGRGVPVDLGTAVVWWTKAAEQGSPAAQMRLAEAYRNGAGVTRDLAAAESWYGRAAQSGVSDARVGLFEVTKEREREARAAADAGLVEPAAAPAETATDVEVVSDSHGDVGGVGTEDVAAAGRTVPEADLGREAVPVEPVEATAEPGHDDATFEETDGATVEPLRVDHEAEPEAAHDTVPAEAEPVATDQLAALVDRGAAVILRLADAAPVEPEAPDTEDHAAEGVAQPVEASPDDEAPADDHGSRAAAEDTPAAQGAAAEDPVAPEPEITVAEPAVDPQEPLDASAPDTAIAPEPLPIVPESVAPAATTATEPAPDGEAAGVPDGAYGIWLASFRDEASAKDAWTALSTAHGDVLGALRPTFVRVEMGEGEALYRVQAGPFASAVDAQAACTALGERSTSCIAVAR